MNGVGENITPESAKALATAYKRAITQKKDGYDQIGFSQTLFKGTSLEGRSTEVMEAFDPFKTASITVGRDFSDAMAKVLVGEGHSEDFYQKFYQEFYQKFRKAMNTEEYIATETNEGKNIKVGVRETLGENPKLKEIEQNSIKQIVNCYNPSINRDKCFSIKDSDNFASKGSIPFDLDFVKACQTRAEKNGDIVIMCGVNVDSLGEKGVLEHPDKYAPKPMSCHAKSSYFGFTKGFSSFQSRIF